MKLLRLWAPLQTLQYAIMAILGFASLLAWPADAQEGTARPFVQDQYYLGHGNQPPTLEQFSRNPMAYLRNEEAYRHLRLQFARKMGRQSLSKAEFKALFAAGKIRAEKLCTGRIETPGILPSGKLHWTTRDCYTGERLMEVNVSGQWKVVASQGCFNSVRLLPLSPPPVEMVCKRVPMVSTVVTDSSHQHLDGVWHPNCCCDRHPYFTPGFTDHQNSNMTVGGSFLQCRPASH